MKNNIKEECTSMEKSLAEEDFVSKPYESEEDPYKVSMVYVIGQEDN